jgi:hypothetical protein
MVTLSSIVATPVTVSLLVSVGISAMVFLTAVAIDVVVVVVIIVAVVSSRPDVEWCFWIEYVVPY